MPIRVAENDVVCGRGNHQLFDGDAARDSPKLFFAWKNEKRQLFRK